MTLRDIRRWLRPWIRWRAAKKEEPTPEDVLASAIPGYPKRCDLERYRKAHRRGAKQIVDERRNAVLLALAGGKPRIRVKAWRA